MDLVDPSETSSVKIPRTQSRLPLYILKLNVVTQISIHFLIIEHTLYKNVS